MFIYLISVPFIQFLNLHGLQSILIMVNLSKQDYSLHSSFN